MLLLCFRLRSARLEDCVAEQEPCGCRGSIMCQRLAESASCTPAETLALIRVVCSLMSALRGGQVSHSLVPSRAPTPK